MNFLPSYYIWTPLWNFIFVFIFLLLVASTFLELNNPKEISSTARWSFIFGMISWNLAVYLLYQLDIFMMHILCQIDPLIGPLIEFCK